MGATLCGYLHHCVKARLVFLDMLMQAIIGVDGDEIGLLSDRQTVESADMFDLVVGRLHLDLNLASLLLQPAADEPRSHLAFCRGGSCVLDLLGLACTLLACL